MQVTQKQFKRFSHLVYNESGINLHAGKQKLLCARLAKRLRQTGIKSVDTYLEIVETDANELINFLDAVSTNHTFFFRERHHFDILAEEHMNIWCAASSSGEEPYSIAIDCAEKGFRPSILATDISTQVLRVGSRGVYPLERAKDIDQIIMRRYFQKGNGKWSDYVRVKDDLRKTVNFKRYNLIADPIPSHEFDVVFCRNVLIYFDNAIKTEVVNKLYKAVRKGGYFIIGGAESLNSIKHKFAYVRPSIYRKESKNK